ncbi:MAG: SRPBCC family protein [Anaerolineaceae bacterium]|nr:SRPBCC family protein [Anaerolineaceae bacterium]
MDTLWSLYGMLTLILITGVVGYGVLIFATNPHSKDITAVSAIRMALRNVGVEKPAWRTLIVSSTQDVKVPANLIWEAWSKLEEWPVWSGGIIGSTRWVTGEGWQVGAQFEQSVSLGFPVGTRRSIETVEEFEEMRRVRWCRMLGGAKACHVWSFTYLPNGNTRITNTEVYHGTTIGLIKPLVAGRWERAFHEVVSGLVSEARKQSL